MQAYELPFDPAATDIRWKQRLGQFQKVFLLLVEVVDLHDSVGLTPLESEGMIKRFELTYETCWLTLKDYLVEQGYENSLNPRGSFELAFSSGIIRVPQAFSLLSSIRNTTVHNYNAELANTMLRKIANEGFTVLDLIIRDLIILASK
jgi:nucleotidyltransferase substrate binding protein (TIGR01987 family)